MDIVDVSSIHSINRLAAGDATAVQESKEPTPLPTDNAAAADVDAATAAAPSTGGTSSNMQTASNACTTAKTAIPPGIEGKPYIDIRQRIIAAGWIPSPAPRGTLIYSDYNKSFIAAGVTEFDDCAADVSYCNFSFKNKDGTEMDVITKYEDNPSLQMKVVNAQIELSNCN